MRNIFTHRPTPLPGLRQARRHQTVLLTALAAALLALAGLGYALRLGDDELLAQQALDEQAAWLGGFLEGRAQTRQTLTHQVDARLADAYQLGLAEGRMQACPTPGSLHLVRRP
ncbi:MAG: hypothetical protein LCI02_04935 [Proteobacteria bacterium]|nr:hypothetical protein [Pseudomonadota bacterium]